MERIDPRNDRKAVRLSRAEGWSMAGKLAMTQVLFPRGFAMLWQ
jgi:hypothetical protein